MFFSVLPITALFFSVSSQRVEPNNFPEMFPCFNRFSKEVLSSLSDYVIEIAGGSFLNEGNQTNPDPESTYVVAYSLPPKKNVVLEFVVYAQVGRCTNEEYSILQINNSDPYSLSIIMPLELQNYLFYSCGQSYSDNPLSEAKVYVFGNRNISDYERAFMKMSSKLSQCPDLCLGPSYPVLHPQKDPRACGFTKCRGYCDNADDPTDICICSDTFLTRYQDKNGNQILKIVLIGSGALGIVALGCIVVKKACKKGENEDLNTHINDDEELSGIS